MNELQIFKNSNFGEMRTTKVNGQPYICLVDICKILDIKNVSDCKSRLSRDGVVTTEVIDSLGREQQAIFINESNLYKVIFQSRKPEAEKFTEWVTSEVLPNIRKHGGYIAGQEQMTDDELMAKAVLMANSKIQELHNRNKELEANNQLMQPKADYFDELVNRKLLTSFRDTAKELKIKEKDFINYLIDNRYIYRDKKGKLKPYADKNNDLFEIKECYNNNNTWVGTQTLITPKGRETFRLLYV
jgi:prophage antirepressor-like protein